MLNYIKGLFSFEALKASLLRNAAIVAPFVLLVPFYGWYFWAILNPSVLFVLFFFALGQAAFIGWRVNWLIPS